MIKKLWVAIIAVGIAGAVNAQDVKLGVKLGMNVSSIRESKVNSLDPKTGFVFGVTSEFSLTEKLSLQPELLFSQQGARESKDDFTLDLNYIVLPIMVKYYVVDGFSLEAGPQFSFLVKDEILDGSQTADVTAESFDLMANLGLGYQFKNGVFFQTRYNLGLIDTNISENLNVKNGVFQMSLGYQF